MNKVIGYIFLALGLFSCLVFLLAGLGNINIPYLNTIFMYLFSGKMGDGSVIFVAAMSAVGAYLVKG